MESEEEPPGTILVPIDRAQRDRPIPNGTKFLARGNAADVWLVDIPDAHGQKYVLKAVRMSLESLRENLNPKSSKGATELWEVFTSAFLSKVEQWKALRHTHVISLFGLQAELVIYTEFCVNGTATQYLSQHPEDHISRRKSMISEVLAGVNYLHLQNPPVIHGCICMDKIFVDMHGRAKIGEFGLSNLVEEFGLFVPSISQVSRIRWLSPELLDINAEDHVPIPTVASDVWALGCTIFEIMSGKLPYFKFKHDLRVQQEILSKKLPGRSSNCLDTELSDSWATLAQCWVWMPEQRPTVDALARSALSAMDKNAEMDVEEPASEKVLAELSQPSVDRDQPLSYQRAIPVQEYLISTIQPTSRYRPQTRLNTSTDVQYPPTRMRGLAFSSGSFGRKRARSQTRQHSAAAPGGSYAFTCENCRQFRMKCRYPPDSNTCFRCESTGSDCIIQPRKFRQTVRGPDQLAALLEEKEAVVQGLLQVLSRKGTEDEANYTEDNLHWTERGVRSLIASKTPWEYPQSREGAQLPTFLEQIAGSSPNALNTRDMGVTIGPAYHTQGTDKSVPANLSYTRPVHELNPELRRIYKRQMIPETPIMKILGDDEVEHLFSIFHDKLNVSIALLDPTIHTAWNVKTCSPFLFTVICGVASRYWAERPAMHATLMQHVKSAAVAAITENQKTLEVCQAYLLLSIYQQPTKDWPEDRAWLYLGLGLDLNLHQDVPAGYMNDTHERDQELTTMFGRPSAIPENYISNRSLEWLRSSPYNRLLDLHLCDYNKLLHVVAKYASNIYSDVESTTGFNWNTDFASIALAFDEEIMHFMEGIRYSHASSLEPSPPSYQYWLGQMSLAIKYYHLMMHSLALERSYKATSVISAALLAPAIDAASEILHTMNENLQRYESYRHSPDKAWLWSVYAAMFLIKFIKPRSTKLLHCTLTDLQRERAILLIETLIRNLRTNAVDGRHIPALYAQYLSHLLVKTAVSDAREMEQPNPDIRASVGLDNQWPGFSTDNPIFEAGHESFWDNLLLPGIWGISMFLA
ncbi:Fungal specific transcription factor domain [Rhizoctonia solani]|uniref:Fungal specific transcription factor domain n=1 Tax=Rhizoctonia solani TaxID=456999 RepID=A0A8H8P370_9AGAM|nr:Fungal specific transcription factor domain [Rhizoctonia solani]QRW23091.1 Fungal specific transcription factor domain [Rhizoctonia solani]